MKTTRLASKTPRFPLVEASTNYAPNHPQRPALAESPDISLDTPYPHLHPKLWGVPIPISTTSRRPSGPPRDRDQCDLNRAIGLSGPPQREGTKSGPSPLTPPFHTPLHLNGRVCSHGTLTPPLARGPRLSIWSERTSGVNRYSPLPAWGSQLELGSLTLRPGGLRYSPCRRNSQPVQYERAA